jgi:diadenosine tetraphosphate (Ap4A) HIT family hydrolase
MEEFRLDPRLRDDSRPLGRLRLCEVRLMDERRWPWIILVPQVHGATELHDLGDADIAQLSAETATASAGLKQATGCLKINSGALGNVVRQLHVHVVARNEGDDGWPGPVWGRGARQPRGEAEGKALAGRIRMMLFAGSDRNDDPL